MKLKPNANIPNFIRAVQDCHGTVRFVTPAGDDLDLKSAIAQFLFIIAVSDKLDSTDGEIQLDDPADLETLQRYFV